MAFMVPEVTFDTMYRIGNSDDGWIPEDVFGMDYLERVFDRMSRQGKRSDAVGSDTIELERGTGWFARLSASGYLDCTDWEGPFDSESAALESLCDTYEVDSDGEPLEA